MDIKKLQTLVKEEAFLLSEPVKDRILANKMTLADINFMERSINTMKLLRIRLDLETLVPAFQEAAMRLIEQEEAGDDYVDLEYVKKLVNDATDYFVELSESVSDIGLSGVIPEGAA